MRWVLRTEGGASGLKRRPLAPHPHHLLKQNPVSY